MRRTLIVSLSVLMLVALAPPSQAAWTADANDWPTFRADLGHSGRTAGTSAFTDGEGGFSKAKWDAGVPYPALGPASVGDLDGDGAPEVVVQSSDVRAQVGPPPNVSFNQRVDVLEGGDGGVSWFRDEGDSFAFALGANVAEIDNDDKAEVAYFVGNPLTGTSATNGVMARSHTGAQQWKFADAGEWGPVQRPIGIVTGIHAANVDGEAAQNETVFSVSLADLAVGTTEAGPGCPNPNAQKIKIEASNIKYVVHAVNGEGASASNSWKKRVDPGLMASTPVIADLNGDGKNDVVWGSGAPEGPIIPSCSVEVRTDASAVDDRIIAINGANPPASLWEKTIQDPPGVRRPVSATPVVAGSTAGGDPILAFLIPVPDFEPAANDPDRNILLALNGRTGDELWRINIRPATIAPLSAADLDDDGQPEIIVQVGDRLATFDNRTGDGHWAGQGTGDTAGVVYARSLTSAGVAVGDLDSDGVPEIATILDGSRTAGQPKAELLVVGGADGAVEWTRELIQDDATGGPVLADVDGDDDLLEIVVAAGSFTVTDNAAHSGRVFVIEPNAPDLTVDSITVNGSQIVNEPQSVRVRVRNAGTRAAAGATLRLTDNGALVGEAPVSVAAGASQDVDVPWTPSSFGNRTLAATADPANVVRELAENNNTRTSTVRIKVRPDAAFTFAPAAPNETQTVAFTNQSTDPDNQALSHSWSCTDGFASTQASPSHKFADGGSFDCTLTVTDADGLSDAETRTVVVTHVGPNAAFSFAEPGSIGLVSFTDASTHPNGPDAPPAGWSYAWDFDGDGITDSTQRNPSHDFGGDPGDQVVKLTVTDNDGLPGSATRSLRWPVAAFTHAPALPAETDTVQFTDQSTDPDGSIASRSWSCTDGFTSAQANPSHRFADGGTFGCTLTVTDNQTLTDAETKAVTVAHVPPDANFSLEVLDPGEVQFTDTSTHPNPADAPAAGWTFAWDFEDDGVFDSSARNPFHDYGVDEGVFDIRLRVTDNDGKTDEVVKTIDVALVNEVPTADFTWGPQTTAGHPVTFTDQSNDPDGQIVKIEIDFDGNGTIDRTIQGANVAGSQTQHTYAQGGDFLVSWTVTDDRGATATQQKAIHICQPPGDVSVGPGIRINLELCSAI